MPLDAGLILLKVKNFILEQTQRGGGGDGSDKKRKSSKFSPFK